MDTFSIIVASNVLKLMLRKRKPVIGGASERKVVIQLSSRVIYNGPKCDYCHEVVRSGQGIVVGAGDPKKSRLLHIMCWKKIKKG
ncbi:hypothetical protein CMI37_11520 [Candidatus Pacearchaeota archaeon]|nr:hypothetical protein [Candidatus Pacearchaeota archaeon]